MYWRWPLAALVAMVGASAAVDLCVAPYRCNRIKQVATATTAYAFQRSDTSEGRVAARQTLAVLAPCMRRSSCRDVGLDLIVGGNYRVLGRYEDALGAYRDSLRFDRRPEIYLNLGAADLALGDHEGAVDDTLRACLFNPWMIQGIEDKRLRSEVIQRLIALRPENADYIHYIDTTPHIPWGT